MSYSVKRFIKKNCTEKYDLEGLKKIASQVTEDSAGRYTDNSALKILCRYAYVQNNKIMFNVDCRDSDQTLAELEGKLKMSKSTSNKSNKDNDSGSDDEPEKDQTNDTDQSDDEDKKVKPSKKPIPVSVPVSVQPTKTVSKVSSSSKTQVKKGGFGNLSSLKRIIKSGSDNDEVQPSSKINTAQKSAKPVQKKDDSDNSDDSKPKKSDIVSNKTSKSNDSIKSTKSQVSVGSGKRDTNLFANTTKSITSSSSTASPKASASGTRPSSSVKAVKDGIKPPAKKGGFGVFNKAVLQACQKDCDDNKNKKSTSMMKKYSNYGASSGNKTGYRYPDEPKYAGVIRNDPTYGPYGTDSYHQVDLQDDEIPDNITHRIDIYRKLESQYYPPQRSPDWFKMRDEMTTASDGGTVVGLNPYEQDFGFITKKVHGKPFETSEDCYHGKKYEQVATMSYEYRMNVRVKEFGLCRHPKYDFLGASPDGIVSEYKLRTKDGRSWDDIENELAMIEDWEDKRKFMAEFGIKTKYVGRMLEIKCPMRRKILMAPDAIEVYGTHGEKITDIKKDSKKGICPTYYWVQVQLQLQCCELEECDFWQCEIWEYADKEDFLEDTDTTHPWLSRQTGHEKGVVIQLMPYEQLNNKTMEYRDRIFNFASFIYQPRMDMTPLEIDRWICDTLQNLKKTHKGMVFERVLYWKIVATRNITIKRDDKWFADNLETFRQTWEYVKYFRANKDKSNLLKRYINTFPLDCYKKIKEGKNKGIIMKTIQTLYAEPAEDAPNKEHKAYAKFIANLEKEIEESGVEQPKEYDVTEDINYIKEALALNFPADMEDEEKEEQMKKFVEFIKQTKNSVQSYLYQENE